MDLENVKYLHEIDSVVEKEEQYLVDQLKLMRVKAAEYGLGATAAPFCAGTLREFHRCSLVF